MDQFNKALSFILGLVVVVVFIAVATGKINLKNKLPVFSKKTVSTKTTPTPTPNKIVSYLNTVVNKTDKNGKATVLPSPTKTNPTPIDTFTTSKSNLYQTKTGSLNKINSIPSTGVPFAAIPLLSSSLAFGIFLRKKK